MKGIVMNGEPVLDIKTFEDLIDWSRELHHNLSRCLTAGAQHQTDDKAGALLAYLADHEQALEQMVDRFEQETDQQVLKTRVYDYLSNGPLHSQRTCDVPYSELDYEGICREVFDFHTQLTTLYQSLIGKAETANARELMESLLTMEEHESMRLAKQIDAGRAL
ncbi:ATPase [Saccharospirillum impatiens]|uniref:ATPase n=1 Tax=Saccharospirillum impatiens TaxID=169438 RepID=UPI00040A4A4D|nr:ATPase [Saccharospirillum impatiens]